MSISLVRSRPLDPLFLAEDGLASGSSIPSAAVFGQSPESAMVNEIFNNPDAWSLHVPTQQEGEENDSEVSVGTGEIFSWFR